MKDPDKFGDEFCGSMASAMLEHVESPAVLQDHTANKQNSAGLKMKDMAWYCVAT